MQFLSHYIDWTKIIQLCTSVRIIEKIENSVSALYYILIIKTTPRGRSRNSLNQSTRRPAFITVSNGRGSNSEIISAFQTYSRLFMIMRSRCVFISPSIRYVLVYESTGD